MSYFLDIYYPSWRRPKCNSCCKSQINICISFMPQKVDILKKHHLSASLSILDVSLSCMNRFSFWMAQGQHVSCNSQSLPQILGSHLFKVTNPCIYALICVQYTFRDFITTYLIRWRVVCRIMCHVQHPSVSEVKVSMTRDDLLSSLTKLKCPVFRFTILTFHLCNFIDLKLRLYSSCICDAWLSMLY